MKHLCIITYKYPTAIEPTALTFVQQFAWAVADKIDRVSVICPVPINLKREYKKYPTEITENINEKVKVHVYFPKYYGFGMRGVRSLNTIHITTSNFCNAVDKVLRRMSIKPNVLYGHFVTPAGICCSKLGKKYNIPSYFAYGESTTWSIDQMGRKKVKKLLENITGVVSVSSYNKKELIETNVAKEEKIKVFPNGFIKDRFSPKEKSAARDYFGLPQDVFIACFVGQFIERKGIGILCEAIAECSDVNLICAGKGPIEPFGKNVLYVGSVLPEELAFFYSAADVFVLPTKNEGCCNAIIEAMACGLPIISSDLPFNDDILTPKNSLRINPNDKDEIKTAICKIRDNMALRQTMKDESLKMSQNLSLENRANKILKFIRLI